MQQVWRQGEVIASIEAPEVIQKILKHLGLDAAIGLRNRSPPTGINSLFNQATTTLTLIYIGAEYCLTEAHFRFRSLGFTPEIARHGSIV